MDLHWIKDIWARKIGTTSFVTMLIAGAALVTVLVTVSRAQEADHKEKAAAVAPRAGAAHTDHAVHAEKKKGDDHADDDDHEGHDHDAPAEKKGDDHADDDDHEGHDHDAHAEKKGDDHADDDDHAGHDHGAPAEAGLVLSPEELRNAGVVIAEARSGDLKTEISMPGEVSLNEDRVTHVVPLVGGIAREVGPTVGDLVGDGDVLAVLDSSDLGEAKLDYLTKVNEILCCNILVPRAQAVHDNTLRLLAFLDGKPGLEDLQTFKAGETGENLKTLIGGYAESISAQQIFEREKGLLAKKITSELDYFAAKTTYEKAVSEYVASRDSIAFEVKHQLFEAISQARSAKFEARTSEQRLRLMGVANTEISALEALVLPEEKCTDPNCTGCKAGVSAEERERYFGDGFSRYEIHSPASGIIVEKHIVRGERIGDDAEVFTLADTSTVWVNLTVYLKDLSVIRAGQETVIRAEHSGREARGQITMVSPLVNTETRTATARVVLENDDGSWRPGVFVIGRVAISAAEVPVVVPKNAVQTVEGEKVVFVPDGKAFKPVPVRTGRSDRERIEIVSGLAPGASYVTGGAYELKAKLVTSNLDPHAGHGH